MLLLWYLYDTIHEKRVVIGYAGNNDPIGLVLCVYFLYILLCNCGGKLHNNVLSIYNLSKKIYIYKYS